MTNLGKESLSVSDSYQEDFATLTRNAAMNSRLKRGVVAIQLEKHNINPRVVFTEIRLKTNPTEKNELVFC